MRSEGALPLDLGGDQKPSDQPFLDLGKAFSAFFEGLSTGKRKGDPGSKARRAAKPSFYLANDQFELGIIVSGFPSSGG